MSPNKKNIWQVFDRRVPLGVKMSEHQFKTKQRQSIIKIKRYKVDKQQAAWAGWCSIIILKWMIRNKVDYYLTLSYLYTNMCQATFIFNSSVVSTGVFCLNQHGYCTLEAQITGLGLVDVSPAPQPPSSCQVPRPTLYLPPHSLSSCFSLPLLGICCPPIINPRFTPSAATRLLTFCWCAVYNTCINQAHCRSRHCNLTDTIRSKRSSVFQAGAKSHACFCYYTVRRSQLWLSSLSNETTTPR